MNTISFFYAKEYTGWSKNLCAPDDNIVIIMCTETFWSPCSLFKNTEDLYMLKRKTFALQYVTIYIKIMNVPYYAM